MQPGHPLKQDDQLAFARSTRLPRGQVENLSWLHALDGMRAEGGVLGSVKCSRYSEAYGSC